MNTPQQPTYKLTCSVNGTTQFNGKEKVEVCNSVSQTGSHPAPVQPALGKADDIGQVLGRTCRTVPLYQ